MLYDELFHSNPDNETIQAENAVPPAEDVPSLLRQLVILLQPAERIALLEKALRFWPEDKTLLDLQDFFRLRYHPERSQQIPYADKLLGVLMESMTITHMSQGKRKFKQIHSLLTRSPLFNWADKASDNPTHRELFFGECMNVLAYYVDTCRKDKRYASSFMGLIKADERKVEQRLSDTMRSLSEELDEAMHFDETRRGSEWTPAMKDFAKAALIFHRSSFR